MRLWLERFGYGSDSTLGKLHWMVDNGEPEFLGFILEDERREVKVPGETCIPPGVYPVTLRAEGGMTQRYANRFPEMHEGMAWIRSVPNFEYVYFHIGNTDDDSEGCLLTGTSPVILSDGEFQVARSTDAYKVLYPLIAAALASGEDVVLSVTEK